MRKAVLRAVCLVALALARPVAAQDAPSWCRPLPPEPRGIFRACSSGPTPVDAERAARAALAMRLESRQSIETDRNKSVTAMSGTDVKSRETVQTNLSTSQHASTDLVLHNASITRQEKFGKEYFALAEVNYRSALRDSEQFAEDAMDALDGGRVQEALSSCATAHHMLDSLPVAVRLGDGSRGCATIESELRAGTTIELTSPTELRVVFRNRPLRGVSVLMKSRGEIMTIGQSDAAGRVAVPEISGRVGGGEVSDEFAIDWSRLGLGGDNRFVAAGTRKATVSGHSVYLDVSGFSDADRSALTAAINREIRDHGWVTAYAPTATTWKLEINGSLEPVEGPMRGLVSSSITLNWTLYSSDHGAPVAKDGLADLRGTSNIAANARINAIEDAAKQIAKALEEVSAKLK